MNHYKPLSVTSEIGRLREVIVHTPGREIEMVTPRNSGRMLFEDILYPKAAIEDHNRLVQVLRKAGVEVLYFQDLLSETLHLIGEQERRKFVRLVSQLEGCPAAYCERLSGYSPEGLADVLIGGEPREESLTRFLRQDIYAFPPIPNMMFVRDGATVVGNGIILSCMTYAVRSREVLLFDLIFARHPRFSHNGVPPWRWLGDLETRLRKQEMVRGLVGFEHVSLEGTNFRLSGLDPDLSDGTQKLESAHRNISLEADYVRFTGGPYYTLEGGNIFVLSRNTLLIGCGQRTSAAAVDALAREMLSRRGAIRNILVAITSKDIKGHLDTFLSAVDKDQYMVYPPVMEEYGATVTWLKMWLDKRQIRVQAYDEFEQALKSIDMNYKRENIGYCAGVEPPMSSEYAPDIDERILQEREWHGQALNILPLAPGKLILSERNRATLDFFEYKCGYERIEGEAFCGATSERIDEWLEPGKRIVIILDDSELSRAHGGPRSLVLPLRRDALEDDRQPSILIVNPEGTSPARQKSVEQEATDLGNLRLSVRSETGRLCQVVLHAPGKEIERLTSANHDALLYDDVLDQVIAEREHQEFSSLLRALEITVYEVESLIAKALEDKEVAGLCIEQVIGLQREAVRGRKDKWLPSYAATLGKRLSELGSQALARTLVEGVTAPPSHPALFVHDADPFLLTPIPNILFMRDPAAIVGDNAIVCYMRMPARRREGLLLHYALQTLKDEGFIQHKSLWLDFFQEMSEIGELDADEQKRRKEILDARFELQCIEGGDILVIHDQVLALGCSERTTRETLEQIAAVLFGQPNDNARIQEIYAVLMPAQRSSMHLDTIFTMISEDECLIYPPMILPEGIEQVKVLRLTLNPKTGEIETEMVNSLVKSLEAALRRHTGDQRYRLTPVLAGGENPLYQDREQWCDAANVLAIAPGIVVGYERNYRTFRELEKAGYNIFHAREVIADDHLRAQILDSMNASVPPKDGSTGSSPDSGYKSTRGKYAIQITGRELSRARGGARCMAMPLYREEVSWDRSGKAHA